MTFIPPFSIYKTTMIQNFIPYGLLFLSGVAGLGYEILWTRLLSASLGHEIISALAVISAYFSGLALGAWLLDDTVYRSAAWVSAIIS